ncbi:MAG TPA: hypothetical protein VFR99_08405 [Marmoricola sp.]|nr:hypothetical protein [Marmoricola sp.]
MVEQGGTRQLSAQEISDAVSAMPGWSGDESGLSRVVPAGGSGEDPDALVAELRSAVEDIHVERDGTDVVVRLGDGAVTAEDVERAAVVDRALAATSGE